MTKIKLLITLISLFLFTGFQNIEAQSLSKEVRNKIKEKEQEIRTSEEMLMSGVEGIERTKSRLEKAKKSKKNSPEEIAKKENKNYPMERVSSHKIMTYHLGEKGLFDNIDCALERPWGSSMKWYGDIRFLRADPNLKHI